MKELIGYGDWSDFEFYTDRLTAATEARNMGWRSVQRFERPIHLKSIDRTKSFAYEPSAKIQWRIVRRRLARSTG
jgi:hypothetical protein